MAQSCALLIPNLIVDAYFIADIFVNFNTSSYDWERAQYVMNRRVVAKQYLGSWFVIDFVSCLPIDSIVPTRRRRPSLSVARTKDRLASAAGRAPTRL